MILTEKEALRLFCPMAMSSGSGILEKCHASDCMAWRFASDPDGHPVMKQVAPPSECPKCGGSRIATGEIGFEEVCEECDGEGKIGHYERMGFCGLAGRPGV